jgi:hypothetical protein
MLPYNDAASHDDLVVIRSKVKVTDLGKNLVFSTLTFSI